MQENSVFGILLNQGLLPNSTHLKSDVKYLEMIKYVYEDMLKVKFEGGYRKLREKYYEIQADYAKSLIEIVKTLLKSKSEHVKNQTLRFLATAVMSNLGK